jgi:hypothetical protein
MVARCGERHPATDTDRDTTIRQGDSGHIRHQLAANRHGIWNRGAFCGTVDTTELAAYLIRQ